MFNSDKDEISFYVDDCPGGALFDPLALYVAVRRNDIDKIQKLVINGLSREYYEEKITYLSLAVLEGSEEIVRILAKSGAKVNRLSYVRHFWRGMDFETSETALITAVRLGHVNIVAALLELGARPNRTDTFYKTALHWACDLNLERAFDLLLRAGGRANALDLQQRTPLSYAAFQGHVGIVERFLAHGLDLARPTERDLLRDAVRGNKHEMVRFLLQQKCFDIQYVDEYLGSYLHYSVDLLNYDMTKLLLENGINVNLINRLDETPLHLASDHDILSLLLVNGALLDFQDKTSQTPLVISLKDKRRDVGKALLQHGAACNVRDLQGNSLLYLILNMGFADLVPCLLCAGYDLRQDDWLKLRINPFPRREIEPAVRADLELRLKRPKSLQLISIHTIRNHLKGISQGRSILSRIYKLPISPLIKEYVSLYRIIETDMLRIYSS